MNFEQLRDLINAHTAEHRPIRLRFAPQHAHLTDLLIVKRIEGGASVCGFLDYQITCVSNRPGLPLAEFIAIPLELQLVTDRGELTSVCGIIESAAEGHCDGGFATYRLILRDALSIMQKRVNTRVFLRKSELDITHILVSEWRRSNFVLGQCFKLQILCRYEDHPLIDFAMQQEESDAAFLTRLWKRRGIAWVFRPSTDGDVPSHTLTLFENAHALPENAAGAIRYHPPSGTQERDCISSWAAVTQLQPGRINRATWHPQSAMMFRTTRHSDIAQGPFEQALRACLDDYRVDAPNANLAPSDYQHLGNVRMLRHDYERSAFFGESDIRDLAVGEWNAITGHHELDRRAPADREFLVTSLHVEAENNLPIDLDASVNWLFDRGRETATHLSSQLDGETRYRNSFTCVRRGTPVVPAFDPVTDLPAVHPMIATVVCGEGREVDSNEHGWIRIRIPGCRVEDHEHAGGAGSSDTASDSAWVPIAGPWAGQGYGFKGSFRHGDTVLLSFLGGDPDCPVVLGAIHSGARPPVAFSNMGTMPDNQALSGMKSRELGGQRHNQMRFDDSPGKISAQLSSEHADSQLNLGYLTHPRTQGYGRPRGEGAELRSDASVAIRGACGVLISADAQARAGGNQLDRDRMASLAATLKHVQEELNLLSEAHRAEAADLSPMTETIDALKRWDEGSNIDPDKPQSAPFKPLVAIDAPSGLAATSGGHVLLGAGTNVDVVSVRDTHLTAGRMLLLRAMKGLSLVSHSLGMKLVAASGKLKIEAHDDDIELTAAKRIVLTASEEIVIQAPKVTIIAQGAQSLYGSGELTHKVSGTFTAKYAKANFGGSADGQPPEVALPSSEVKHNQRVVITDLTTGEPLPDQRYRVTLEDGNVIEGTTDKSGVTETFDSKIPFGGFTIALLDTE